MVAPKPEMIFMDSMLVPNPGEDDSQHAGLAKRIAGKVFGTTLKWIDQGYKLTRVDDFTQMIRIATCEACTHFDPEERRCKICTCEMDFKTGLMYEPTFGLMKKELIKCADEENPRW